jgi:hypothetical protein
MEPRNGEDEGSRAGAFDGGEKDVLASGLTAQHLLAVDLLVAGVKVGEVATRLSVRRETIWRWQAMPEFQAQLRRIRAEFRATLGDRVQRLFDKSLDVIEQSLDEGDPQAATDVFKTVARALPVTLPEPSIDVRDRAMGWTSVVEAGPAALTPGQALGRSEEDAPQVEHACPICSFVAKNAAGLKRHRRAKHR